LFPCTSKQTNAIFMSKRADAGVRVLLRPCLFQIIISSDYIIQRK
jgi:hypothetical protein